jgi:hemolysin III
VVAGIDRWFQAATGWSAGLDPTGDWQTLGGMRVADPSEELAAALGTAARPLWRGRLHQFALLVLAPLFVALVVLSRSVEAKLVAAVYGLGVCSMLTVSTIYHRWVHTPAARAAWQRRDHAMIFAAIAGSFTPVCVLAVPHSWGIPVLALMWAACLAGAATKFTNWRHRRVVGGVLYIGLGWASAVVIPPVWQNTGPLPVLLIGIGGLFYTGGAILLYHRRPRLRPAVFSYHETWHACTVIAAIAHLAGVWTIINRV